MKLNIYLFDKNDELLEQYNEIWEKVSNNLKKEFDSEPVYSVTLNAFSCPYIFPRNLENSKLILNSLCQGFRDARKH